MLSQPQTKRALTQVDAKTVASMVFSASDLTLVLDRNDVVRDASQSLRDIPASAMHGWIGRPVTEIVRLESRSALAAMLAAARADTPAKRVEIVHAMDGGRDLPVQYSVLPAGDQGELVLAGRDLRTVADLQSRLQASRQSADENTRRQRQAEAHYRLLFETASEAIVIVDAESGRIREANPRAASLLASAGGRPLGSQTLAGRKLGAVFAKSHQADLQAMLAGVMASGEPARLTIEDAGTPAGKNRPLTIAAELFRAGDLKLVLLRIAAPGESAPQAPPQDEGLGDILTHVTEAVLLADADGNIVWVNESFLALASLPLASGAIGKPLEAFFDWQGIEQDVLLANVRMLGRVPVFAATVRGANRQSSEVELSAVVRPEGQKAGYAFVMRARLNEDVRPLRSADDLTRTAENLVEMIGRVPMKDMVRDTTDVIERMCIEAALKLSENNRALTARVLGLSRQALYLKMRRFGIAGSEEE